MFNIIRKFGTTRTVYLIGKYAIKFPTTFSWEFFLRGLLGNMNERRWSKFKNYSELDANGKLCPVLFCMWGGWILIMPKCEELSREEFSNLDFEKFTGSKEIEIPTDNSLLKISSGGLPVENKLSSFGKLNGEIVALDYGQ